MNRSIVSKGLYLEGLRRSKIISFIFLAYIFVFQVIIPLLMGITMNHQTYDPGMQVGSSDIILPLIIIPYIWVPLQTLVVFHVFDKRGASDFYHSLPYTRSCMTISWILSVFTITIGGLIAGTAAGYLIRAVFPDVFILSFDNLAKYLLFFIVAMLFACACTLIAMSVTGTVIANIVCGLLIMYLPRFIMYMIRSMIMGNIEVLSPSYFLPFFDVRYNLFTGLIPGILRGTYYGSSNMLFYGIPDIGPIIYTILLSLAYFAIAVILFNRRKSETAENSASSIKVQAVIRSAVAFTVALVGTYILGQYNGGGYFGDKVIVIAIYIVALIVFIAYELITTRKWSNVLKAWPSLVAVILLNAAILAGVNIVQNNIVNNEIRPEQIRSVRIINEDKNTNDYFGRAADDIEITDPTVIERISDILSENLDAVRRGEYYSRANAAAGRIAAINTGGETVYRYLQFKSGDNKAIAEALSGMEVFREAYMNMPEPDYKDITLTLADQDNNITEKVKNETAAKLIFDRLKSEISSVGFEKWYSDVNRSYYYYEEPMIKIYSGIAGEPGKYMDIMVPVRDYPQTSDAIMEYMYDSQNAEKFLDLIKDNVEYGTVSFWISVNILNEMGKYDHGMLSCDISRDTSDYEILGILYEALKISKMPETEKFMIVSTDAYQDSYYDESQPVNDNLLILPVPQRVAVSDGNIKVDSLNK